MPSIFSRKKSQPSNNDSAETPPYSPEKKPSTSKQSSRQKLQSHRSNSTHSSKSFSRSSTLRYDPDEHPLNLPPDELRRFSALSAMSDQSSPVNGERDSAASPKPTSPVNGATSPSPKANGNAVNGVHDEEDAAPVPPPHKVPTSPPLQPQQPAMDPEACKAAGNKFFKAKEYEKAIREYSKGLFADPHPASPKSLSLTGSVIASH